MTHKVVKPFPYSVDGVTLIDLNVGDERDFGTLASGLVSEGWVEATADIIQRPVEPSPKVEPIPEPVVIEPEPAEVPETVEEQAEKPAKKSVK